MSAALKDKRVRGVLEDAALRGDPRAVAVLSEQKAHEARRRQKAKPSRERKAAKREERNDRTAQVRDAVWRRSGAILVGGMLLGGFCEACGVGLATGGDLDHWIGGSSRRKETTMENCWRLCPLCDHDKTNMGGPGHASYDAWNENRRRFCAPHGYTFVPRKPTLYHARASSRSARDAGGRE